MLIRTPFKLVKKPRIFKLNNIWTCLIPGLHPQDRWAGVGHTPKEAYDSWVINGLILKYL